ncbi:MAG: hypothetical protein FWB91_11900 [Defluviitaleaceae bacterium]|nr:hypothetical protein [Defluviitaleaceae bacterium]
MQIKTTINYNLDLICFLNSMTGNKFFSDFHMESAAKFYPLVSQKIKRCMKIMLKLQGEAEVAASITLLLSSLNNFDNRDLIEMLKSHAEIKKSMSKTPYSFKRIEYLFLFRLIRWVIIPLVKELENAGYRDFWQTNRLPLIKERCNEINKYLEQYDAEKLINQFKNVNGDSSGFTVYICSFAKPLGLKLCGNNILTDFSYDNDTVFINVTHEAFHPPYDVKNTKHALNVLAKKSWVKDAYKNQNPDTRYNSMDGFIEENIVEALGIYVAVQLGVAIDPKEYFRTHDSGSHVISPYFYDYLCEHNKNGSESFDDYFINFVDSLSV